MARDSKKKEEKHKESEFKKFVKKRAPIYLAVITLVLIFIVPELTKSDLESSFPKNLTDKEKQVLETLMHYKGPNEKGLSILNAISNKISEEYPNEKIYNNKKTHTKIVIDNIESDNYQVVLNFQSYKGELNYDWNVNLKTGKISGNNSEAKYIIDLVNFYD